MKELKEKKGITLIALIVTVIILLILAAVSVSMVNGNGLFGMAKTSSKKYTQAQLLEKLELAKAEYLMDNVDNNSFEGFISYLKEHKEEYGIEEIEIDNGEVTLITEEGYVYSIKNTNGEISIEGYGQESDLPTIEAEATRYEGTYDGNAHGISVVSTTPGATITYSTDGETYTSELPTFTQTGGYTTYYKVKKEGYKTVSGSLTVTISRANGGITISESSGTFYGVESKTITVSNNTGTVSAESSDTNVAEVSVNGNEVTITSKEQTTDQSVNITITSQQSTNYEEATATYIATVKSIKVSSITISPSSTTIELGNTQNLSATILPENAKNKTITWDSDNKAVATVSSSGVVSALSVGTTTITATANDGSGVYGQCTVVVVGAYTHIGQYAFDNDEVTYESISTESKVYIDSSSWGKNMFVYFSTNVSGYGSGLRFKNSSGTVLLEISKNYSQTYKDYVTIPNNTVYIETFHNQGNTMTLYSLEICNTVNVKPTFQPITTYTKLANNSENAITSSTQTITITYHESSTQRLYKIGNGNSWTAYTGPVTINKGQTIYAKGIDADGRETKYVPNYTANINSIDSNAFDNSDTTYQQMNTISRIDIDSSLWGKNIYIYYSCNVSGYGSGLRFKNSSGTVLEEISRNYNQTYQDYFTIPNDTAYIETFHNQGNTMTLYSLRKSE